jgi:hypothetical protein
MQKLPAAAFFAAVLTVLSAGGAAWAADVTQPVKTIMDATVSNWLGGDSEWEDIFDDAKLEHDYSKDFVAKYQAAAQFPAADDGISPFDYDVIVGGQDSCPLEDVNITPQPAAGPMTEVVATFKKSTCMGSDADYQKTTAVRFKVIEEAGRPVIDDIVTMDDSGHSNSLKAVMQEIVRQQPSDRTEQPQQ